MKNIALLILFLISGVMGYTQQNDVYFQSGEYRVIAPRGLNMRDKPSVQSNVVKLLDYGEKMTLVHKDHYGLDTLGTLDICQVYNGKEQINTLPVQGYWLKVAHEGIQGFVYSAYIMNNSYLYDREYDTNIYYDLLRPGGNCIDNFRYNESWNYYGLYYEDSVMCVKPIERISFTSVLDDFFDQYTSTENDCGLQYILGTKESFPIKEIEYSYFENQEVGRIEEQGIEVDTTVEGLALFIEYGDQKRQLVNHKGKKIVWVPYVRFIGDLDGDGWQDYIISYGEKDMQINLYLTTEQSKDGLFIPSASYFTGYCC